MCGMFVEYLLSYVQYLALLTVVDVHPGSEWRTSCCYALLSNTRADSAVWLDRCTVEFVFFYLAISSKLTQYMGGGSCRSEQFGSLIGRGNRERKTENSIENLEVREMIPISTVSKFRQPMWHWPLTVSTKNGASVTRTMRGYLHRIWSLYNVPLWTVYPSGTYRWMVSCVV